MTIEKYIDHTLLKAEASLKDVELLCQEALKHNFASVCVNPTYVRTANQLLQNSEVKVCTVIGFPLGANLTDTKLYEAKKALGEGAEELDYVINISDVKNGNYGNIEKEMAEFVALKYEYPNIKIKVILEICYLSDEEVRKLCHIAKEAKIDFIKTSTGFGKGGAVENIVALMSEASGPDVGVKASGGIRTREDAEKFISLGATRIGTSNGVSIVNRKESPAESRAY
jgi:deoxyribose-phosphate aldolase